MSSTDTKVEIQPSETEEVLRVKKKIQSSIPGLSVGSERKCFNQIRRCSEYITPETLLWNGMSVGEFCMSYVIGHHMKRKRKAEEKASVNPDGKSKKRTRTEIFNDVALFEQEEKHLTEATSDESLQLFKEEKDTKVKETIGKRGKRKNAARDVPPAPPPGIENPPEVVEPPPKKPRAKRKAKESKEAVVPLET
ncbi:MAG: hypothetical protein CMB64_04875 [Euryarchaeota archaeon]|nr:hypothetical protein [Euryarchaeota archaeon]|tara:strand:- start:609 stop:1190 length:582 start_codon:yes stop_codon:yes gene_type:complete